MTFTSNPKHPRTIDHSITAQARARDGVCLYGLLHKDGCKGGLDGHHITAVGEGGDDVITNIISLCRWHHNLAELRQIAKEELYAILALFHGYEYEDIAPWTKRFLAEGSVSGIRNSRGGNLRSWA